MPTPSNFQGLLSFWLFCPEWTAFIIIGSLFFIFQEFCEQKRFLFRYCPNFTQLLVFLVACWRLLGLPSSAYSHFVHEIVQNTQHIHQTNTFKENFYLGFAFQASLKHEDGQDNVKQVENLR